LIFVIKMPGRCLYLC